MCSSAIMHSWLQYLAPHIAHWCPSNGKVDTQCRLQRLRVLNKSRFGLLSARVMFNHCSIAQCSCDPSCLLLQLLHTPWFDTPRTPIFVDASLTFKRTTALLFHCHQFTTLIQCRGAQLAFVVGLITTTLQFFLSFSFDIIALAGPSTIDCLDIYFWCTCHRLLVFFPWICTSCK